MGENLQVAARKIGQHTIHAVQRRAGHQADVQIPVTAWLAHYSMLLIKLLAAASSERNWLAVLSNWALADALTGTDSLWRATNKGSW